MSPIKLPKNIFLKILTILFAIPFIFYLLPFIIGGLLIYFIYKKANSSVFRNGILSVLLLFTAMIGSGWVSGLSQGVKESSTVPTMPVDRSNFVTSTQPTLTLGPTKKSLPTAKSLPTNTPYPTKIYISPTNLPITETNTIHTTVINENNDEGWACNCSKTCSQMSSCAEAQYQLNTCGCSRRDGDHDGIACDADCQ